MPQVALPSHIHKHLGIWPQCTPAGGLVSRETQMPGCCSQATEEVIIKQFPVGSSWKENKQSGFLLSYV